MDEGQGEVVVEAMDEVVNARAKGEPLAVEFANTVVTVRGERRDELAAWLERAGVDAEAENGAGTVGFRALRDAVRSLLTAVTGSVPVAAADVAVLNAASATVPRWPVLEVRGETGLTARELSAPDSGGAARLVAAVARDAVRLLAAPQRADLRACQAPHCVQFFVKDHPRREWCGPACGNRVRAARHYRRTRAAD